MSKRAKGKQSASTSRASPVEGDLDYMEDSAEFESEELEEAFALPPEFASHVAYKNYCHIKTLPIVLEKQIQFGMSTKELKILQMLAKTHRRDLFKNRELGRTAHRGGNVDDVLESFGRTVDLHGGVGRRSDRPLRRGLYLQRYLDRYGGGVAGDEFVGDAEEEFVIPVYCCTYMSVFIVVEVCDVVECEVALVDERAVLKQFDWLEPKADALREAAFGYCDPKKLECESTLCAARRVAAFVCGDDVIHKLFTELAYRYK
ncbi:hypothetical protein BUALT_Bualt10G0037000 [Buddleja alternifolia]|uniref:Uncharacterized protein n=1 Tax=Buddleja alternifolia TaxID=168488 RepID=A0AAV6X325_9LAMI|nr:hypothetical protein BUALT_Bualt10G0037000 [Buddleja alternifolia]